MEFTVRRGRRLRSYPVTIGRDRFPGAYTPAPDAVGPVRLCDECHAKSKPHDPGPACKRAGPGVCRMCKRPKPAITDCDAYDFRGAAIDPNWVVNNGDDEFHAD